MYKVDGVVRKCWKCGSQDIFITTPVPVEEHMVFVTCCNVCASWAFVRQAKSIARINKALKQKKIEYPEAVDAPQFTMDFTLGLDTEK